jgi:DNA-binding transcriptional regulator YiaG
MTVAELPPSLEPGTKSLAALSQQEPRPKIDSAWKSFDAGTAILKVRDLTDTLGGTMLIAVEYEGLRPDVRRATATRMARIREMAPTVSLRDWASVLGVSPQAVRNWSTREPPNRPELAKILRSLEEASLRRPLLGRWLKERVVPDGPRPIDFMADQNWRAFRASSRLGPAASPRKVASSSEMQARLRERHGSRRAVSGPEPPPAEDGAEDPA